MSSAPPRLAIYVDGANVDVASEAAGIHIDYVCLGLSGRKPTDRACELLQ